MEHRGGRDRERSLESWGGGGGGGIEMTEEACENANVGVGSAGMK